MSRWSPSTLLPVASILLAGCLEPPLERPTPTPAITTTLRLPQAIKNKVDLLFLIDDSASMAPMSEELKRRFPQLLQALDGFAPDGALDLHIGVISSDYGAGLSGAPGCAAAGGGSAGRLVARGRAAAADCRPPQGANFIRFRRAPNGPATSNLPLGQDLLQTFTCMASVVGPQAVGCGFEHQLEAAYAALHDDLPENRGFLRDDALLAVVFVTNEDDCSAPRDSQLFDKSRSGDFGYLTSFRCNRAGHVCGQGGAPPPYGASGGPLSCRPAPGGGGPGHLFDVSRYSDLFTRSRARGGLKDDPNDVVLFGIMPPLGPYEVILANPGTTPLQPYVACGALSENGNPPCVPMVQHSCRNPGKPEFFGDPPLRIAAVINAVKNHATTSICADDYFGALDHLGKLIITSLRPNCLPPELARAGALDCNVRDEILNPDGTVTALPIPSCASAGGALPCWHVEPINDCKVRSPEGMALAIDRGGAPTSGQRWAVAACANPPIAK